MPYAVAIDLSDFVLCWLLFAFAKPDHVGVCAFLSWFLLFSCAFDCIWQTVLLGTVDLLK